MMNKKLSSLQNTHSLSDNLENQLDLKVINSDNLLSQQGQEQDKDSQDSRKSKRKRCEKKNAETLKIEQILWALLRKIYLKMYQGLENLSLSLTPKHLQSLNLYLKYPDKEIRKLVLLIITTRMKFEKHFRRAWIKQFSTSSNNNQRLILSPAGTNKQKFFFNFLEEKLDYNQGTLFYFMKEDMSVNQFEEYQLGQVIVNKILTKVPEVSKQFVWFDRSINTLIRKNIIQKKKSKKKKRTFRKKDDFDGRFYVDKKK